MNNINVEVIHTPEIEKVYQKVVENQLANISNPIYSDEENALAEMYAQAVDLAHIGLTNCATNWLRLGEMVDETKVFLRIDYQSVPVAVDNHRQILKMMQLDGIIKHPKHQDVVSFNCTFKENGEYDMELHRLDPH